MTDSMQFGPEWLRNLSQQDDENTMVIPKYQLAEYRYGREEMLALFDKTVVAPEPLHSIGGLYVEKIQLPLALIQMSEEETRVWNSNVNNDTNQRSMMKNTSGQTSNMGQAGGGNSMVRGRGNPIAIDRMRGGRSSRGPYHYNTRNYSEEGADTSHPSTAFGRPRIFDKTQSHTNERMWSERNGNVEYNEWNGYGNNAENGLSTSPRKDFGNSMKLSSSREDTNWRRRPTNKDEDDGWRSSRHGRTGYNWRDGAERDREKEKDNDGQETSKDRRWMTRISSMHSQSNRRNSESRDDNLPEWATESLSEGGGTFDASGAFHGGAHSEDDDLIEKSPKSRKDPDRDEKKRKNFVDINDHDEISRSEHKFVSNESKKNKVKEKSPPLLEGMSVHQESNVECSQQHIDNRESHTSPPPSLSFKSSSTKQLLPQQSQSRQHQNQLRDRTSIISEESYNSSVQSTSKETTIDLNSITSSQLSQQQQQQQQLHHSLQQQHQQQTHELYPQLQSKLDYSNTIAGAFDAGFNFNSVENPLMSANPTMVHNLTSGSVQTAALKNKLLITPSNINNTISLMNQKNNIEKSKSSSAISSLAGLNAFSNIQEKAKDEELDCIVGDVVSKFMAEEEEKEKLKKIEGMNKWYYRDPQGEVQGPFSNTEMAEWYKLGYFHDKSLIVRRAYENHYYSLHDLVTYLNGSPFETVTAQNFNKYSRISLPSIQLSSVPNTTQMPTVPNVPDETLLMSQPQHYQSLPYDVILAARQQQILAAKKRQLSQTQEGLKSLFEQQKMMSQHMNNTLNPGPSLTSGPGPTSSQPNIPIMPGYIHPMIAPNVPSSSDPNFVMLLNRMQQQQQHQLHQHLLQQQMQQQHHQQQQQQIQQTKDIKVDRLQQPPQQPDFMSHIDHPLQQLVQNMNNLTTSNQIPLAPTPSSGSSMYSVHNESAQPDGSSATIPEKAQPQTNAIQNLLKQLRVTTDKQPKSVDSIWGSGNVPSVPVLNNNTFNAQHWCSQVGKIGPSSGTNNTGLWPQEGGPPTIAMKTEQEIIESFMKTMKRDDSQKEAEHMARLKKEEELRLQQEAKKKEEKMLKREEEKLRKKQEEEKLRRIEEEQRRKAVEEAKRREEERRRKEEEKQRREEEKEQKRKAEEEKKRRAEASFAPDMKDVQRETMKRLKEQQAAAMANKPLKSIVPPATEADQPSPAAAKIQKSSLPSTTSAKQLSKSQSNQVMIDPSAVKNATGKTTTSTDPSAAVNKQVVKSKSTSSVPTPTQKTTDNEKKGQEKKKKDKNAPSAWADQKKVPQVKSLAEIQAEEQKKLAKQIEKEKQERLLQQQQAAINAQAAKEATDFNIWKSPNQPWKNKWSSTVSSSSSLSTSNSNDSSQIMFTTAAATTNRQSNTASTMNTTMTSGGSSKTSASASNVVSASSSKKVPSAKSSGEASTSGSGTNAVAKNKAKKEDSSSKKPSTSSVNLTQAIVKNDDLSKWGVKALSSLKPSVDVPTFIAFLREVESPHDVMEYVTDYLGDGKEIKSFVKQFLEKRSGFSSTTGSGNTATNTGNAKKSKNKKTGEENSSNQTKGSYLSKEKEPVSKTNSAEFVEVKAKSKKAAKKKVLRLDNAFLNFNVTAAPDRINIGDRDYGDNY